MSQKNIVAFSGSLRKGSYNTELIRTAIELAGDDMKITLVDISNLPMYNQDLEASFPTEAIGLKDKIKAADGVLIATPEHNRSIPTALKNMLDWSSRPYGETTWTRKPVAVIGATAAQTGTTLAQYHLKQVLNYLNANVMGQPEFYVSEAMNKFDGEGNLTDEKTKEYVKRLLTSFQQFIG